MVPKKPEKYIIRFEKELTPDMQYRFEITYCISAGNLINDLYNKKTEIVMCPAEKQIRMENSLHNKVVKTYNRLYTELRKIGANQTSIEAEVAKRMR